MQKTVKTVYRADRPNAVTLTKAGKDLNSVNPCLLSICKLQLCIAEH